MRSLIIVLSAFCLFACTAGRPGYTHPAVIAAVDSRPHYNDLNFWAAHPNKRDPADSVPQPLRKANRDTVADVFFIHPTTFTEKGSIGNASLADAALNRKTDESTILLQASAFNQRARVFAPRYRQGHLANFYLDSSVAIPVFDTAYADVKAAFNNYLQQHHHNRPIVIAAHSQGAMLAIRLLREFFDGKVLQQKLVAAYIVGWPVLPNTFGQIPVCSSPDQIGCFASWRTFREGYVPPYVTKEQPPALVTNPLTWRTDSIPATAALNKGSVLRQFNKVVPRTVDARVHGGVLWVSRPKIPGAFLINTPNYHIGDINLFYVNIRENVADRINAYLRQHAAP